MGRRDILFARGLLFVQTFTSQLSLAQTLCHGWLRLSWMVMSGLWQRGDFGIVLSSEVASVMGGYMRIVPIARWWGWG